MLPQPWIVLAEIINFLVLVALLQRFLYKPIMRAMAERERSIAERLQLAEARETEAHASIEQYAQLQADWSQQLKSRQHQMHQQVEVERTERLDHIRDELETQRGQWYAALRQEQKACLVNLRDRARSQLIQTIRAALKALADTSLETQMVETFLHQLPRLSTAERDSLIAAVKRQQKTPQKTPQWVIRTTFPLEPELQARLVKGIQTELPPEVPFESYTFEIYPEYPCGIELRTQGYKLAWHLEHYLNSLESQLAYALDQVPVL